jgi:hypothetical protein
MIPMTDAITYETTMFLMGRNTGVPVPPEVLDALGGGKRPAVTLVVNGYEYASTVGVMGGRALVPFSSDKRTASGIAGGDALTVTIALDTAPRTVEVPADLRAAIDSADASEAWERLSPSARKAHVTAVEGAKAEATRQRRIEGVVAKLIA